VLQDRLRAPARKFPIVTVTGPRQSGKTTLCRAVFADKPYVSLEAPDVRAFAHDDPRGFLAQYAAGAVLDEVHRAPELLSYIQTAVDERPAKGRFILTGSANLTLLESVSQSLAGRTALLNLLPLSLEEVRRFKKPTRDLSEVLWHGSYPALFDRDLEPGDSHPSYVGFRNPQSSRAPRPAGGAVLLPGSKRPRSRCPGGSRGVGRRRRGQVRADDRGGFL